MGAGCIKGGYSGTRGNKNWRHPTSGGKVRGEGVHGGPLATGATSKAGQTTKARPFMANKKTEDKT